MAKKPAPQGNFGPAKRVTGKVVEKAAAIVPPVVVVEEVVVVKEVAPEPTPVAAGPRPKKARYVREKKDDPTAAAAPLPPPSRTATGKMMSRDVKPTPKKPSVSGTKDAKGPPRRGRGPS